MQYRKFGKLDWKVSALGFGAMRLPLLDTDMTHVNEAEAIRMIRYAIDRGVNYVDTAYPYHGGNSERVVGLALQDGYRQRIRLATKLPARQIQDTTDFERVFSTQLDRLQTKKVDFYLMHGLNGRSWPKIRDLGVVKWAEGKIAAGQIGNIGFSFHDEYDAFTKIVDDYDNWTFCQLLYNYMDIENQAGRRGVEYAASKDLGVIVMEPIRGGILAKAPPDAVKQVWGHALEKRNPAEWALQWVWNQPEISLALSGMSNMQQVEENLISAGRSGIGSLTTDELALFDRIRNAYRGLSPIPCTSCRYCLPCPNGVAITGILQVYNEAKMYQEPRLGFQRYAGPMGFKAEERADQCLKCEECVEKCPQKIPIPQWLENIHAEFAPKGRPLSPPH